MLLITVNFHIIIPFCGFHVKKGFLHILLHCTTTCIFTTMTMYFFTQIQLYELVDVLYEYSYCQIIVHAVCKACLFVFIFSFLFYFFFTYMEVFYNNIIIIYLSTKLLNYSTPVCWIYLLWSYVPQLLLMCYHNVITIQKTPQDCYMYACFRVFVLNCIHCIL